MQGKGGEKQQFVSAEKSLKSMNREELHRKMGKTNPVLTVYLLTSMMM